MPQNVAQGRERGLLHGLREFGILIRAWMVVIGRNRLLGYPLLADAYAHVSDAV